MKRRLRHVIFSKMCAINLRALRPFQRKRPAVMTHFCTEGLCDIPRDLLDQRRLEKPAPACGSSAMFILMHAAHSKLCLAANVFLFKRGCIPPYLHQSFHQSSSTSVFWRTLQFASVLNSVVATPRSE